MSFMASPGRYTKTKGLILQGNRGGLPKIRLSLFAVGPRSKTSRLVNLCNRQIRLLSEDICKLCACRADGAPTSRPFFHVDHWKCFTIYQGNGDAFHRG